MNKQERVKYPRIVRSGAMSKRPYQNGLSFSDYGNVVRVESTNPKTDSITSHLYMEIPKESIQEVIDKLKQFI